LLFASNVFSREREQRQMPGALDSAGQTALMLGAGSGLATRANLTTIRQVTAKQIGVLIGNFADLVEAEVAQLGAAGAKSTRATSAPTTTTLQVVHLTIIITHGYVSCDNCAR
jgi:hypothetical protein